MVRCVGDVTTHAQYYSLASFYNGSRVSSYTEPSIRTYVHFMTTRGLTCHEILNYIEVRHHVRRFRNIALSSTVSHMKGEVRISGSSSFAILSVYLVHRFHSRPYLRHKTLNLTLHPLLFEAVTDCCIYYSRTFLMNISGEPLWCNSRTVAIENICKVDRIVLHVIAHSSPNTEQLIIYALASFLFSLTAWQRDISFNIKRRVEVCPSLQYTQSQKASFKTLHLSVISEIN